MSRRPGRILSIACAVAFAAFFVVEQASAVPNFSKKTGLSCAKCHLNFPRLNKFGRDFMQNGYVRSGESEPMHELSETLALDKYPIGMLVKLRPFDKKKSGDVKVRSFHELELFIAGSSGGILGDNISFFTEIEAEDETDFTLEMGGFEVGYHPMPELNFAVGNRPLVDTDPFQTLSNHGKVTRSKRAMYTKTYGSGEKIGSKQNVGINGVLAKSLYYGFKYGADVGDPEGEGKLDAAFRVACVLPLLDKSVTIGGYYNTGDQASTNAAGKLGFTRTVVDFSINHELGSLIVAYQTSQDDLIAGGSEDNAGYYVEASYNYLKDGNPLLVPTIRYDAYEKTDGADSYTEVTANVAFFARENVKCYVEYWQELDIGPLTRAKNDRVTLQIEFGF